MKILYIANGLPHYYNLVLSRIAREPEVELIVVAPCGVGTHVGAGVYQTREGVDFRLIELEEFTSLRVISSFRGLAKAIVSEGPDVVIVPKPYLSGFLLLPALLRAMRKTKASLILKEIPFSYLTYEQAVAQIERTTRPFSSLPRSINSLLQGSKIERWLRKMLLNWERRLLNRPEAHVNYVEAREYWTSYGVSLERIFITRNSPDTDKLFSVRERIKKEHLQIMPPCRHRLIHVGRLVAWKRVDMLIRAVARARAVIPDIELIVIGSGPEEERLKSLAVSLNMDTCVRFVGGEYDPQTLGRYFMESTIYVLAGMGGLSINEAMCFGLPILCSIGDGTERFLVREGINGAYFKDGDEDDLLSKITMMLGQPEKLISMGDLSIRIIQEEVNIQTVVDGYIAAVNYAKAKKAGLC